MKAFFDPKTKRYNNRIKNIHREGLARITKKDIYNILFENSPAFFPKEGLPHKKIDANALKIQNEDSLIWLGHSSIYMKLMGTHILIDPVISSSSPFKFLAKRFSPSVITSELLKIIDLVMISHDHYDHLDKKLIYSLQKEKTKFIVPLGVDKTLEKWGIDKERISSLDWWDEKNFNEIKITSTPAQHNSGRSLFDRDKTLWCSYVIEAGSKKYFFSGDSGYDIHFEEIGKKWGSFDLSMIECGQYHKKWQEIHMLPSFVKKAFEDLHAKCLLPIHWGVFKLGLHPWDEPIEKIENLVSKEFLLTPMMGENIFHFKTHASEFWWRK